MSETGVFTRSKSGGVITIKGNTGNNIYPPAPIRDLILKDNINKDNFNLSFTSPGEDLNSGIISEYLIFYSENRTLLEELSPTNPTNLSNPSNPTNPSIIAQRFHRGKEVFNNCIRTNNRMPSILSEQSFHCTMISQNGSQTSTKEGMSTILAQVS